MVLTHRLRLIESARKAYKEQGPSAFPPGTNMPMEAQYWIKQPDGTYGWTGWTQMFIPQAGEIARSQQCPDCGAYLIRRNRQSSR